VNYDPFKVVPNVVSADAHRFDPRPVNPLIAVRVALRCTFEIVSEAIDLNGQPGRFAEEIENVGSVRVLAAELQSLRAEPKHPPQTYFRGAHSPSKLTCCAYGQRPLHQLRWSPSPRNRGEDVKIASAQVFATTALWTVR
jgi:hypothetical protein